MTKITKDMIFAEILEKYPQVGEVIMNAGLHCLGCSGAASETVEQGCKMHGFDDEKIAKLVEDMNKKLEETGDKEEGCCCGCGCSGESKDEEESDDSECCKDEDCCEEDKKEAEDNKPEEE